MVIRSAVACLAQQSRLTLHTARYFPSRSPSCTPLSVPFLVPRGHSRRSHVPSTFFRLAAACSAKNRPFNPDADFIDHDASAADSTSPPVTNHRRGTPPSKRLNSGEDAFFMANVGTTGGVAFGIADGVGGWADSGVDPSDFSHGICHHMATTASQYDDNRPLRAQALLQTGYVGVVKDPSIRAGGSTACVGVAHPDGVVEVANLGDSGFAQLRLNAVRHMSAPQTHAFNTPYQLSLIPPHVLAQSMVFGGRPWQDLPKDASVSRHDTRHGDVLVFATDGVWDNISPQQLLKMVSRCMQTTHGWRVSEQGTLASEDLSRMTQQLRDGPSEHPTLQSLLASTIAGEAKMASLNRRVDGPFAKEVQRLYPSDDYRGGKVDDICVVVAIVIANPDDLGASNT